VVLSLPAESLRCVHHATALGMREDDMTNDTNDRHWTRSYARFDHKGVGKRAASKGKRRRAKADIATREKEVDRGSQA